MELVPILMLKKLSKILDMLMYQLTYQPNSNLLFQDNLFQ